MKRYFSLLGTTLLSIILLLLFIDVVKAANTVHSEAMFTVNSSIDAVDINPGDGICETANGNGICTLRASIMEANALTGNDTIIVPAGNYTITLAGDDDVSAVGDFDILESLEIVGAGSQSTIIDGNTIDRIFQINAPNNHTITISGLTIQNGNANGGGGICHCSVGSNLILSGTNIIANNTPNQAGGGIRNFGQMTLINTSVVSNTGEFSGGGLANEANAVMTITDTTVAHNVAEFDGLGGGISNQGLLTISNVTIWRNSAVRLDMGSSGGGIFNSGSGQLWIVNSTVGENSVFSAGGGLFSFNSAYMTVTNSTIYSNTSASAGADNIHVSNGTVKIQNSIVAGSNNNNCNGTIISGGFNLDSSNTCGFTSTGDITDTVPMLGNLHDNGGPTMTYALLSGSPAVDTANDAICPTTDQRGIPRPIDGDGDGNANCDIGAFELEESDFYIYLPIVLNP